jgi:DNA polymerase-3 subunit epsilon
MFDRATVQRLFRKVVVRPKCPAADVDLGASIRDVPYTVVDTELTGLRPGKDSIISVGAVKMFGGRINLGDFYYRVAEPRATLTGSSVLIHGITPSEAAECPGMDVLLPEFLGFIGQSIVVGHFVSIDLGFINGEARLRSGCPLPNLAVDTARVYAWIRKKDEGACAYYEGAVEDMSLFSIAGKYGIRSGGAHNALNDAFLAAQLFQRFMSVLPGLGIKTVGDLLRVGSP